MIKDVEKEVKRIAKWINKKVEEAHADEKLAEKIRDLHDNNWLVVLLTAGPADTWLRDVFKK